MVPRRTFLGTGICRPGYVTYNPYENSSMRFGKSAGKDPSTSTYRCTRVFGPGTRTHGGEETESLRVPGFTWSSRRG